MALDLSILEENLRELWLPTKSGLFHASNLDSADRFATAVVAWFSLAQSDGFPCNTAIPRKPQLVAQAAMALSSGSASSAGTALGLAVAAYITGQSFGPGVASPPTGTAAASAALASMFLDLPADRAQRARQVASACGLLARSTLVDFTAPVPHRAPVL